MASSALQRKPDVVDQLNELFGNVLNLDIIESVAVSCQYDVHKSSNKLLELSSQFSHGGNCVPLPKTMTMNIKSFASTGAISKSKPKKQQDIEAAIADICKGYKVLVLLRGLPGSGKSYLSKQILQNTIGGTSHSHFHILSTDDFFYKNGQYIYDPHKLSEAHGWNHSRAFQAVSKGISPVIIDNTNTQMWEMKPYATMAVDFGYIIHILEPNNHWCFNDKELAKRNTHGVPKQKIRDMIDRFDKNVTTEKLLSAYSLYYKPLQRPPQYRKIPPINNINNHNLQGISKSQSASALNQDTYKPQRNVAIETINLMEFNEISPTAKVNTVREHESPTLASWSSDPVDEILMWNDPVSATKVLKPSSAKDDQVILIESDVQKQKSTDIESAWGINMETLQSWNVVTPLQTQPADAVQNIPLPSSQPVIETRDSFCNTDDDDTKYVRIIIATNRDINLDTPNKSPGIPKKIMVDKSCFTERIDNEDHIKQLKVLFPTVPERHLISLYRHCSGDVDWAVELLLENKDDLEVLLDKDCDETPENIETEQPVQIISTINFETPSEPNKSPVKRKYVQSQELKSHLFSCKQYKPKNNHSTSKVETTMTTSGEVLMIDSDIEFDDIESEKSSDSGGCETIELNLGDSLINQLENKVGDPCINYPKGFQPIVQLPIDLAKQLYMFYIESVYQQIDAQKEILNQLVKEDEELAKKLQAEEQPNTSPSHTEGVTLSGQWNNLTPETLADKLTKQKLFQTFPTLDRNVLVEILNAHNNNYQETVETLIASAGEDNIVGCVNEAKNPPINETMMKEMKEAHQSSQNFEEPEGRKDAQFYREEASKYLKKREELHQKAQGFYSRGMIEVAQFYSNLASQQTKYLDTSNHLAAQTFLQEHSERLQDFNTLDLHYLYVKEAIPALDLFLDRNINLLQGSGKNYEKLTIITGRGKRSHMGVSKIKPAVIARLKKRRLRYTQLNPGLLEIKITKDSLVSSDVPS
ncbi:NEDD4-binding protein 2 [Aethina tumida]|uniref:NEDD4-binding protein 2 n=1 Tax=Aethina tumida TaxID=116153 RepID=UPI002147B776|nr:NEDD4-binding protein 2 [Aethina tumida]XP_049820900.1 NEDD4-binding protein 2 [Aethina tumida]